MRGGVPETEKNDQSFDAKDARALSELFTFTTRAPMAIIILQGVRQR